MRLVQHSCCIILLTHPLCCVSIHTRGGAFSYNILHLCTIQDTQQKIKELVEQEEARQAESQEGDCLQNNVVF